MKIISIKIDEFGGIIDKTYDFSLGFNLVTGDNESGKSTILQFIKFIFYGIPRKNAETATERSRSFSWESGKAQGSLTLLTNQSETYTIVRKCVLHKGKSEAYTEEIQVIDEKTGAEVPDIADIGEHFLGVSAPIFESTCFIKQASVGDIRTSDVGSALENMLLSADENLNLQKSLDKLDSARRLLLHRNGKGGTLAELENEKDSLEKRLSAAKEASKSVISKTDMISDMKEALSEKRKDLDMLEDICTAVNKVQAIHRFDELHEKEKNLQALEDSFETFKESVTNEKGFIPDEQFTSAASEGLSNYISSAKEQNIAKEKLENAQIELGKAKEGYNITANVNGDDIRMKGGVQAICDGLSANFALADKKKKTCKLFSILSISIFVATLLLFTFGFIFKSAFFLVYVGIGTAISAIVLLILSLSFNSKAKSITSTTESDLTLYGVLSSSGANKDERIALVKQNLETCLAMEEKIYELTVKKNACDEGLSIRNSDYDTAYTKAESILSKWNISDAVKESVSEKEQESDHIVFSLKCVIEDAKLIISQISARKERIAGAKHSLSELSDSLKEYDEADLRARVTEEVLKVYDEYGYENIDEQRRFAHTSLRSMSERCTNLEKELIRLTTDSENPARISALIEENAKTYKTEKLKYDGIIMAQTALANAGSNIRNSVTPLLKAKAEQYMATLSDGKYDFIGINENYGMLTKSENSSAVHSVDLLSAGTKDMAYLALRLSLVDMIFRGNNPFLAVDEALTQLDDTRAESALKLLSTYCNKGGQCILFTCHTRERELISNICDAEIINL